MNFWESLITYQAEAPLLFNSLAFLVLFGVLVLFYPLVYKNLRIRNLFLLAFSLFFYYKSGGFYFSLLLASMIYDYYLAKGIHAATKESKRKFLLVTSVIINLGLLGFFKYSHFFIANINQAFGTNLKPFNFFYAYANTFFGSSYDVTDIILPVGISFYTFQALSYTIDIYRRRMEPAKSIWDFGFFISFFPHLVAGPIVKAADFIPQIYKPYAVTRKEFNSALFLILGGFIKKALISDYISVNFVDRVFDSPEKYGSLETIMAIYGYALQIYCDFSGYSDMAIGLALLLGFRLGINFNRPYKAINITDFWRRWHISLSTWLRDYLYISLGGNRKGSWRTYLNLMITMLLGGLWHGAAWRFIWWGGIHGIGLALHKMWDKQQFSFTKSSVWKGFSYVLTFHLVVFCWIFFRAANIDVVATLLHQLVNAPFAAGGFINMVQGYSMAWSLILVGLLLHWAPVTGFEKLEIYFGRLPLVAQGLSIALVILLVYQFASSQVQPFIYFQF